MADDRMRELEERYEDYTVYDRDGDKIGKVDDLFVDETDREEYIGVRMGLFGLSGTTLIPMEMVRVNDQDRAIEVSDSKEHVKDAPTYSDDDDVTGEFEDRIRSHYGLESVASSAERGSYDRHSGAAAGGAAAGGTRVGDDTRRGDQTEAARHAGHSMGGAQDKDVDDEREREPLGQEEYRNREDMDREPSMGATGTGGSTASGGIPDLETTGEPGRATGRLREAGVLGEPGERGDVGDRGRMEEEGYRGGEGRGGIDERENLGASGATGRPESSEERMSGRGGGEPGGVGDEGMTGGERETQERSERREGSGEQEESGLTRVWRRVRS
ncbi:MAG: PRC-barrel domain-containing protein [Actinobacteria bacterium]|nr:PRC-barrel domain-containing protein [Actinomycetota bacterium]